MDKASLPDATMFRLRDASGANTGLFRRIYANRQNPGFVHHA